jgi:HSP20 family protein
MPLYELGFENRLRKLFEDPFDFMTSPTVFTPPVEIREIENEFVVFVELPGMSKDNVEIEYENGVLLIRGEKLEQLDNGKRNLLVWERRYGAFQRSFMLPNTIDQEKIKAEFKDGILTIWLPKTEAAKGRKIAIAGEVTP